MSFTIRRLRSALFAGATFSALLHSPAGAAPLSFTTPHIATNAGPSSVTFEGQTFVNQGLVGFARLPATTTKDFNGDTFGAFSSLDVLPGSWRKTATGYSGTLYSLPDRGPNGIGSVGFSDYPGRVSIFDMNFTPYTGTANLPATPDSNHQLQLTQTGGFFFKDFNNNLTTGLDPGLPGPTSFVTQNGMMLPGSTVGPAAGKISLDAEGLRFLGNGSFYVSDEYGAEVYYFDKTGRMQGVIQPPAALVPRTADGTLSYTSQADAATGRRFNQGLEGLAVTPDGRHLVTLLQSAAMQDSTGAQQTRTNTRLMIYDISKSNTPTAPVGDYVLQLPVYSANGDGAAVNRTAAQSEILALNDNQFLVLSRDGNGLGLANAQPTYKSILLVDTRGATNIAGTPYENSYTPLSPNGVLVPGITPVAQVEVVNMLNSTQLTKFGVNLNNSAPNEMTLTEKWEGMALVPTLDEKAPQDYFLLVGNDDDFLSATCRVGGEDCSQAVNSDAVVQVYRLTLPTYVDPQFLQSMLTSGPAAMAITVENARELSVSTDLAEHLVNLRHADVGEVLPAQAGGPTLSPWIAGSWSGRNETRRTTSAHTVGATVGLDVTLSDRLLFGAAVGYYGGSASAVAALSEDYRALQGSVYGLYRVEDFYGELTGTYSAQNFHHVERQGAYGLAGKGDTDGSGAAVTGEAGYMIDRDGLRFGPLAGVRWIKTTINGYTESGAAGGNIIFPELSHDGASAYVGGEGSIGMGDWRSILRVTYNTKDAYGDRDAVLALANANDAMATQNVVLPGLGQDHVAPSLTVTGKLLGDWWLSYGADIGLKAGTEHHVSAGLKIRF